MADAGILHNEEGGEEEEEDVEMTAAEVLDKLEEVRSCGITVCAFVCAPLPATQCILACVCAL